MKLRAGLLAMVALFFVAAGTGCADKTAQERDSLLSQNKDLQQQLDAANAEKQASDARADAATKNATTLAPEAPTQAPPTESGFNTAPPPARGGRGGTAARATAGTSTTAVEISSGEAVSGRIELPGDVLFAPGKAALTASGKKELDKAVTTLKSKYAGQAIRVEGYTDPSPVKGSGWDDNWDLGAARARSVLLYLESKGIKNMYIASFGATKLKSTKNMALNRRVDIVVLKG